MRAEHATVKVVVPDSLTVADPYLLRMVGMAVIDLTVEQEMILGRATAAGLLKTGFWNPITRELEVNCAGMLVVLRVPHPVTVAEMAFGMLAALSAMTRVAPDHSDNDTHVEEPS